MSNKGNTKQDTSINSQCDDPMDGIENMDFAEQIVLSNRIQKLKDTVLGDLDQLLSLAPLCQCIEEYEF